MALRTNKQICSRVSASVRGDIFTDCQLDQARKIYYTFLKILSLPADNVAQEALVFTFDIWFGVLAMTSHSKSEKIYIFQLNSLISQETVQSSQETEAAFVTSYLI